MTHDELDQLAENLLTVNKNVLFQWATGCGKTKQAIKAIDLLDKTDKSRQNFVLIVVAEIAHKKNWIEQFNLWNPDLLTNVNYDIKIICYDSLHHYRDQYFDLVILDESHHIGTDIRLDILKDIHSKKFVLLSATMDKQIVYEIENIIGRICVSNIPLQTAIDWGLLPEPKIILIPLTLDNNINNQVIEEVRGNKDKRVTIKCTVADKWKYLTDRKKYPHLRLLISCTERQKYNDFDNKIEYYKKLLRMKGLDSIRNKMLQYGSQRKTFLGSLKDKKAREIIATFGQSRYICFCVNIEQADRLGGSHSIHSEKDDSHDVIDRFNNKEINSLFVVGMLKEGQNLPDIEKGLIIQLDGKTLPFIQKSGRVLRAESPEIYILYYAGTQDEVYLNRALEGLKPEYISYYENHN